MNRENRLYIASTFASMTTNFCGNINNKLFTFKGDYRLGLYKEERNSERDRFLTF